MRPSTTARRYAAAAFEVARRSGDVSGWLQDFKMADEVLQDTELSSLFRNPSVGADEKLEVLRKSFGPQSPHPVRPHVLNLLLMLSLRQRLHLVPGILQEFENLERQEQGIIEAYVTIARPMDDNEERQIAERLNQATGKKVEMYTDVDPTILGGIIIRIGDRLIDASVSGRLQRLRQQMSV